MGLAALAAATAWVWPVVALAALACAFAAAIRLYEAVSGIAVPGRLTAGVALFAGAALIFGELAGGYERVPILDLGLHAVSAAALATVGYALALLPSAGARPRTALWILSVLAFGFAMMVGGLWEVMEFGLDSLLGTNTQRSGLPDTMGDMIANAAGALWGAVACQRSLRTGRAVAPGGLALDFVTANPVIYGAWRGPLGEREPGGGLARADGAL